MCSFAKSSISLAAEEFFNLCRQVFPFSFDFVLTDNGSEFKKHFDQAVKDLHMTHYHTYPRTPKMNAHLERFNRTIQEEFVDYHMPLLKTPEEFNRELMTYLFWYNTTRVHCAFKNKLSPIQFMLSLPINQLPEKCKSGWPRTISKRISLVIVTSVNVQNCYVTPVGKVFLSNHITLNVLLSIPTAG